MRAIYKCRMCGEKYVRAYVPKGQLISTFLFITSGFERPDPQTPEILDMHGCNDGNYGLADFQGFEIEETDKK